MIFGYQIFRDIVSTAETRLIFSEENLVQCWLDVEAALATAQAELGLIPAEAAQTICANAQLEKLDFLRMLKEIKMASHPLVPLVNQLDELCGEHGHYLHWGATTQDILDTGAMLQLKDASIIHQRELVCLIKVLTELAARHRTTMMCGRTLGQQAMPITFGFKVSVWIEELLRHLDRLEQASKNVLVGQLGGAVGTLAGYGDKALLLQERVFEKLGLGLTPIPWQASRDNVTHYVAILAIIGGTISKIAREVATLQRTEIGEVEEAMDGKVGSSTMPHKRNPMTSMQVVAACALLRDMVPTSIDAMRHQHERDSESWTLEWLRVPEACCVFAAVTNRIRLVLEGLQVKEQRMQNNLNMLGGMLQSEALMLSIGQHIGRQEAHHLVFELATVAQTTGQDFRELIFDDPTIAIHLSRAELSELFEPSRYLGMSVEFTDTIVQRSRDLLQHHQLSKSS
jgi:adenylosuccinate lyase